MKLFSEYYAGHINHSFFLFGDDDIKFLEQFPTELWNRAIKRRYFYDLPNALLKREEARENQTLSNLTDLQGEPTTAKYYELINIEAQRIEENLRRIYTATNTRSRHRISQMAYNSAKNQIDSMLDERQDRGGVWMRIRPVTRNYVFVIKKGRHGAKETTIKKVKCYIPELIKRIEGPKGSSTKGYDLSKIQNFDSSIPEENQSGGWRTLGFYSPQNDVIVDNLQAWLGYGFQGLLDMPGSIEDQETHRRRSREEYVANKQARDQTLDNTIYKNPLKNYYSNYINRLKKILRKQGEIDDNELEIFYNRFSRMNPDDESRHAYRRACSGYFPDRLEEIVGTAEAHELDHDQIIEMIQACVGVNMPFERNLVNALADIDLMTHKTPHYSDETELDTDKKPRKFYVDPETSSQYRVSTRPRTPEEIGLGRAGNVPELKPGKILFHVETVRRKLQAKLADAQTRLEELRTNRQRMTSERNLARNQAAMEKVQDEIDQINDLIAVNSPNNIFNLRGVGYHYNMGDVLENPNISPARRSRQKIFLQFDNEAQIPSILDKRDRVLGGGIYPQKNTPQARGPASSNVVNAATNLNHYINDDNNLIPIVADFIRKNYDADLNILFKVFANNQGNPTDNRTYTSFVNLIRDQCLRNIGIFDIESPSDQIMRRLIKKVILHTCNRLVEKDLGDAGTIRQREGEDANAGEVRRRIADMLRKTEHH